MSDYSSENCNGWNDNIEEQIANIGNLSLGYQWIHMRTAKLYTQRHKRYMWCSVISPNIAGLFTIITVVQGNSPEQSMYYQIISIIFSFVSALMSIVVEFGDYGRKAEDEKRAANKYTGLAGNIQRQLNLYRNDRQDGSDYIEWISKNFEDLQDSSPLLKESILIEYAKISRGSGIVVPEAAGMVQPMKYGKKRRAVVPPSKISVQSGASRSYFYGSSVHESPQVYTHAPASVNINTHPPVVQRPSPLVRTSSFPSPTGGKGINTQSSVTRSPEREKDTQVRSPPKLTNTKPPKHSETEDDTRKQHSSFGDGRMKYEMSRLKQHSGNTSVMSEPIRHNK